MHPRPVVVLMSLLSLMVACGPSSSVTLTDGGTSGGDESTSAGGSTSGSGGVSDGETTGAPPSTTGAITSGVSTTTTTTTTATSDDSSADSEWCEHQEGPKFDIGPLEIECSDDYISDAELSDKHYFCDLPTPCPVVAAAVDENHALVSLDDPGAASCFLETLASGEEAALELRAYQADFVEVRWSERLYIVRPGDGTVMFQANYDDGVTESQHRATRAQRVPKDVLLACAKVSSDVTLWDCVVHWREHCLTTQLNCPGCD